MESQSVICEWYGDIRAIASNETEAGRQINVVSKLPSTQGRERTLSRTTYGRNLVLSFGPNSVSVQFFR